MINLLEEIEKVKIDGYNEANAEARICQDIICKRKDSARLGIRLYMTLNQPRTVQQ